MEDSLEDYIRISNSKKNKENEVSSKLREDILITAQIKKQCEARALEVVELFIEGQLQPPVFIHCLKLLNPELYQDVVEERAISKICGYAICGKKLPDMPKKQYHISAKANKVYDISDRKNYCSNFCYKASIYVKNQLDSSPLWLRTNKDCPKFKLLPATAMGIPGELVNHGIAKPEAEPKFTSVSSFTQLTLNEVDELEIKSEEDQNEPSPINIQKLTKPPNLENITEQDEPEEVPEEIEHDYKIAQIIEKTSEMKLKEEAPAISEEKQSEQMKERPTKSKPSLEEIIARHKENEAKRKKGVKTIDIADIVNNSQRPCSSKSIAKTNEKKSELKKPEEKVEEVKPGENYSEILIKIRDCLKQWLSIETFLYIHGEDRIKSILDQKTLNDHFEKLKITELETSQQVRYMEICKKLHLRELAEEKFDQSVLGQKLLPLPDYKQLKEEGKHMNLKVKSFYCGVVYEKTNNDYTAINKKSEENTAEEGPPAVLPLVDASSQAALRRKVFFSSINTKLRNHIHSLKLNQSLVLEDVQGLVKTFRLHPKNVVFRPPIWELVALVLLKLVSLRDEDFKRKLENKESLEYFALIFEKYNNYEVFLSDVCRLIENIDGFIEHFVNSDAVV